MNPTHHLASDPGRAAPGDTQGANAFQILVLVAVSLGFALEGMAAQAFGLAVPALSRAWRLPHQAFADVTAQGLVGFAAGAALAGYLGDRFGRKTLLVLSVALFGAATLGTAACHDTAQLGWVRLATGLGLGGSIPVAAALMSEFSPARWRRLAIALGFMCLPLGGFVSGLLAARLLPTSGWPSLFVACGVVALVLDLGLLLIIPESPSYLALRPQRGPQLQRILARLGRSTPPEGRLAAAEASPTHWLQLFAARTRGPTLALLGAYFALLLGMYLIFSWGPSVLGRLGFSLAQGSEALSAFALGGVFAGPLSGWIAQRFGPKAGVVVLGLMAGATAGLLAWVAAGRPHGFASLAAGFLVLGVCVSGVQTALYALAAEIYPPGIRSSGVGAAVAAGRVGAVLSSYLGVLGLGVGGAPAFFGLVGAGVLLSVLATLLVRPARG